MKLIQTLGYILRYLLIGLGIAALLIVFMPERFGFYKPSNEPTQSVQQLPQPIVSFADMLAQAKPAVVTIQARSDLYPLNSTECRSNLRGIPTTTNACAFLNSGSGVFIDGQGHIVTNAHVLDKAKVIIVELINGQKLTAQIVGADADSDIAILKVDHQPQYFLPLPKADNTRIGDKVFAIGTPYMAFEQTVTQGIVSAKFFSRVAHYIQTDAALRPGNSGGALIDAKGNLVGITSLSSRDDSDEKIYQNFALSGSDVRHVVEQLLTHGQVNRGWLGLDGDMTINYRSIAQEIQLNTQQQNALLEQINLLSYGQGIVITAINGNGPADKAGLQTLDIITAVDGKTIYNTGDLMAAIWNLSPNSSVTVEYLRNSQKGTTQVILGSRTRTQ